MILTNKTPSVTASSDSTSTTVASQDAQVVPIPTAKRRARALCEATYGSASHFVDTELTTVKVIREDSKRFVPAGVLRYALSGLDDSAPAAWCLYPPEMVYPSQGVGGGKGSLCVGETATAGPRNGFEVSAWCGAAKPRHAGPPFPSTG